METNKHGDDLVVSWVCSIGLIQRECDPLKTCNWLANVELAFKELDYQEDKKVDLATLF